ncbi:MAG: FlgD immunoglobulin-like domain containing protein [Bacteroidota bacterium]|nr:FlgD immunoglobulin-like domain containing protein [Bacteroidota bacterium]
MKINKLTLLILIFVIGFGSSLFFQHADRKIVGLHISDPKGNRAINRVKMGLPKSDQPGEAVKWMFEQRAYPAASIPIDWRTKALSHIEKSNLQKTGKTAISWLSVGPHNVGGRVRAIAISNVNPEIVYASSVSGGIFKSTNGGSGWFPVSDFAANLAISSIVIDPNDNNIIYAGTGEGFFNYDAVRGEGVLKSTDAGVSWTILKSFSGTANFPFFVNDIYLRSDSTNILYAATNNGLFKTTNSGNNWSFIHQGTSSVRATQIVGDPLTPATFYVCYGNHSQDGIYKTTNSGSSFTKLSGGFPTAGYNRIALAVSKSNPNILFASLDSATTHYTHSIQKSTDGGANWNAVAKPTDPLLGGSHLGGQGWYNNVIAVHPTDPNIVFAAGINLFKSTNGGSSFSMIAFGYPPSAYPYVHVDHHEIEFHPTNPAIIYFGTDGGVFKSTNTGSTFTEFNNGLATTQFYSGAVHPTSEIYYGGTQDNGTLKSNSIPNWSMVFGGDGGATAVDYNNPNTVFTEYVNLNIQKTTNAGSNWAKAMNGIPTTSGPYDGTTDRVLFIAPFVMDPTNPQILVAGTYKVYRTTNSAGTWTSISNDLTGDGTVATGSKISAIAIAKKSSAFIYVGTTGSGTSTSRIQITTNTGTSWTNITKSPLPNRWVTCIAVDTVDTDFILVGYSGYNTNIPATPGHIFLTTNRGTSWIDVSGDMPDVPVNAIIINPTINNHWLAGTDLGVFETMNGGTNWVQQNQGLANVQIADLDLRRDNYVFAATHGRGMFKLSIPLTMIVPKDTIYPGDANNDAIVDMRDVLPIARHLGVTGSPRNSPSLNWTPQNLTGPFNPLEAAFADCNGDGIVKANDIQGVIQNWYFTRNPLSTQQTNSIAICEELLKEIELNPKYPALREIRTEILRYRSQLLGIPNDYILEQNYPNPFNPNTTIRFNLPEESDNVSLTIFDINGRVVKDFVKHNVLPGYNSFEWDATDQRGIKVSSGVYVYRLVVSSIETKKTNNIQITKKMVLAK